MFASVTVEQLVGMPDLRTWLRAGEGGAGRGITWAHVSELADPTEWLDAGELLMTTGLGIPQEPSAQRDYIERLAGADLSGLTIGHRMQAPELSREFFSAADELSFPVLFTSYEVPFTAVARAVANANLGEESARLVRTQQIYDTVRLAAGGSTALPLLNRLEDIVGCDLCVVDPDRGFPLLSGSVEVPDEVVSAIGRARSERTEPMPALLRLEAGARSVMALAVPASRPAVLLALPRDEGGRDLSVLRHVTAVVAVEMEKEKAERERRRRLGAELLAGLVDARVPVESAGRLLEERGLGREPRVIAASVIDEGEAKHSDMHVRLEDRGIPHLLLRRAPLLVAMLPDTSEATDGFREEVNPSVPVGLSDALGHLARAGEAAREARWALESAGTADNVLARHGASAASPFLPRSLAAAEDAVRDVLGPLFEYDAAKDSRLVESLYTFLRNNKSWRKASEELHVHKQTLVHRMGRVEDLTGRRMDDINDVAEMWLALRTAESSGHLNAATGDAEER